MADYYGKVRGRGDFIAKGLSTTQQDIFYDFFAQGLSSTIDSLGDDWLSYYSVAPIWHFYLQPGVVDDSGYIGTWMPSVDRVNRHFPFMVIERVATPVSSLATLGNWEHWFQRAQDLLLDTLEDGLAISDTLAAIEALTIDNSMKVGKVSNLIYPDSETQEAPEPTTDFEAYLLQKVTQLEKKLDEVINPTHGEIEQETLSKPVEHYAHKNIAPLLDAASSETFMANLSAHSFWLSAGSDTIGPQLVFSERFPDKTCFPLFFMGWPL